MKKPYCLITVSGLFALASHAEATELESTGGRWIPRGTFAISDFLDNSEREKSFAGAASETRRLSTFLPGMTIIYQGAPSSTAGRRDYIEGLTHYGIPVAVLETELSRGSFPERSTRDVVVHHAHTACRDLTCSGDDVEVGIGFSFSVDYEDELGIRLSNTDELTVAYALDEFEALERQGDITRHKDRTHPRWELFDGYAREISVGCDETRSAGFEISLDKSEFDEGPSVWDLNGLGWSLVAMSVFDIGYVVYDEPSNQYVGRLMTDIWDPAGEFAALDFSLVAYRDSSWGVDEHRFAGILQIVNCESLALGRTRPTYVRDAFFYFDNLSGNEQEQVFPLDEHILPHQHNNQTRRDLFRILGRSFFYSVNSATEYRDLFHQLSSSGIRQPIVTANLIARLNASCSRLDRPRCLQISRPD